MNLIKRIRLYFWDLNHGATLELALRRRMIYLANSLNTDRLDSVIKMLEKQREDILK
jgi:hypothetical protein